MKALTKIEEQTIAQAIRNTLIKKMPSDLVNHLGVYLDLTQPGPASDAASCMYLATHMEEASDEILLLSCKQPPERIMLVAVTACMHNIPTNLERNIEQPIRDFGQQRMLKALKRINRDPDKMIAALDAVISAHAAFEYKEKPVSAVDIMIGLLCCEKQKKSDPRGQITRQMLSKLYSMLELKFPKVKWYP